MGNSTASSGGTTRRPHRVLDGDDGRARSSLTGGALATDGTNIYALVGNNTNTFWRYNVGANTWTPLTNAPGVGAGGAAR